MALIRDCRMVSKSKGWFLSRLARQERPELADIRIVRSTADIDSAEMPLFSSAYLEHEFGKS